MKLHTSGGVEWADNTAVDGDIMKFTGDNSSSGIVKFLEPMSPSLNYFEFLILGEGDRTIIGIGVGERQYGLKELPGFDTDSKGMAYHADDGKFFYKGGEGEYLGPRCNTGDRMGCGVVFDAENRDGYVHVFFTRNGCQVGEVLEMKLPPEGLYPLVGLYSPGDQVRYLGHWKRLPDGKSQWTNQVRNLFSNTAVWIPV